MWQRQLSSTGNSCYGHGCKRRKVSCAINMVLSSKCCHVLRACRSRDSNYILQETKRIVLECFFKHVSFRSFGQYSTIRGCAYLPQVPPGLRTAIATSMVLQTPQHPWVTEVRTVDRTVYIYVGCQINISCSTSINLFFFTVLKGFHDLSLIHI